MISPVKNPFMQSVVILCANSSALPILPTGVILISWAIHSGEHSLSTIGDEIVPGAIVITLIPFGPRSLAIGKVNPLIAPLVLPYTLLVAGASVPYWLETITTTPLSPLSLYGSC